MTTTERAAASDVPFPLCSFLPFQTANCIHGLAGISISPQTPLNRPEKPLRFFWTFPAIAENPMRIRTAQFFIRRTFHRKYSNATAHKSVVPYQAARQKRPRRNEALQARLLILCARFFLSKPQTEFAVWVFLCKSAATSQSRLRRASIPTPFVPSGHFPLIGGIGPWKGSRGREKKCGCWGAAAGGTILLCISL